ncbi:uncharacterized protein LOC124798786 [Schistocerca piceifrons]|uniref:uncharacterized protein LOC124798786 n=1 Tax=Schistocerca piceifrons TaxID=274613 RepID=UPI001F5EBA5E|nr:uncharacterized protein LOC124798786 [Schistocerca piceifrons]
MQAPLLLLVALSTTPAAASTAVTMLDCICDRFFDRGMKVKTNGMLDPYCLGVYSIVARTRSSCRGALSDDAFRSSLAMLAQMVPRHNSSSPLPSEEGDRCRIVEGMRRMEADSAKDLLCQVAPEVLDSEPDKWLEDVEWGKKLLHMSHQQRRHLLDELLVTNVQLSKAITSNMECYWWSGNALTYNSSWTDSDIEASLRNVLRVISSSLHKHLQLLSRAMKNFHRIYTAMILQQKGKNMSEHQLTSLLKYVEKLWNLLHVRTSGWLEDFNDVIDELSNTLLKKRVQETTWEFPIRYALTYDRLLHYHDRRTTFWEDFAEKCEKVIGGTPEVLQLADAVHTYLVYKWFRKTRVFFETCYYFVGKDHEWQLEDLSDSHTSVDSSCVQFMVDLLERPVCPLEETSEQTLRKREACHIQLGRDLMYGLSYIPVTSYLAYTQRVNINICLLSWMVISSKSVCENVPYRMIKSVREALCIFPHSEGKSCAANKSLDIVCSVSRAVFSFKCKKFFSQTVHSTCTLQYSYEWNRMEPTLDVSSGFLYQYHSERKVTPMEVLSIPTMKYRNFKIDHLQSLEVSLISINIFFRCVTAGVYLYLPKLRNLPGKLLLCFQFTGIMQILCSEVAYRMFGVPDLATTVQLDSSLTLLSCIWLNTFCYLVFTGVRHLRLPDDLDACEASRLFRIYVTYALSLWTVVSSTFVSLERVSEQYLFHSRALLLTAISLSVACNLLLFLIVAYTCFRTRQSMTKLSVTTSKFGTRKQMLLLSVKTFLLSGLGIVARVGFHQAEGVARYVYCVHLATMLQGPAIFVLFVCNGSALPQLRHRLQRWWSPDVIIPGEDLCSSARRNVGKLRLKVEQNVLETAA